MFGIPRLQGKREADKVRALELLGKFKDLALWREHNITEERPAQAESLEDLNKEFRELSRARQEENGKREPEPAGEEPKASEL